MQKYICECGRDFDNPQSFNGHKSHCIVHHSKKGTLKKVIAADIKRHTNAKQTFADNHIKLTQQKIELNEINLRQWISEQHTCERCGKVMTEKFGSGRFCSRSCANHHELSDDVRASIKYRLSIYAKEHPAGFCSPDFIQKGTRKNHSKRELEIVDYLKTNFPNDDWKQGFIIGSKKYNGYYLIPDLHSNKLQVVLEYDGIWHFKDINGQLANKQAIDRAMVDWCKENNYRLIRIDEDLNITDSQIVEAIYNKTTELELFGSTRYSYLNI